MKMYEVKSKLVIVCVLYIGSFSVNKYVLSVLKFQYPTIFQGWQTLFGFILLTTLNKLGNIELDDTQINVKTVIAWSPHFVAFVVHIYSGSVALSQLAVPVFMSLHNNVVVFHLILDRLVLSNKVINPKEYILMTAVLISSLFIIQVDKEGSQKAYFWMLLHVTTSSFLISFSKLSKTLPDLSPSCLLYLCYLISAVMLLPCTVLLGDAMAATQFAFWYYYSFYLGCVLSGIFGVYLNLSLVDLQDKIYTYNFTFLMDITGLAKLCVSLVSLFLFPIPVLSSTFAWCLVNLCAGALITDLHDPPPYAIKPSLSDPEFESTNLLQV